MTDKELLELAAKAAGMNTPRYIKDGRQLGWAINEGISVEYGPTSQRLWNPLTYDGDALRLMAHLRLEPRFLDNSHSNGAEPSRVTLHNVAGIVENIDGDPYAATRRAIVRAAAEIGRQMS